MKKLITEWRNYLNEADFTVKDKLTGIVNAWGNYQFKKSGEAGERKAALGNLIKVLKSFDVPKPDAIKIIKATSQDEVVAIVKAL